ncbi:aldehyde dehydrogenase (NADP(+)) [Acinetobacter sp. ABJ_C1_1]|uniref:aldehyde dehydrogenase (NADP(+)) n=1 Tax=Acinetobacter sp. ABJ_C1_1 TaxID=3378321 RepID=UPI0037DC2271
MLLTGEMIIGSRTIRGLSGEQKAFNPTLDQEIPHPNFGLGSLQEVETAANLAEQAFDQYRNLPLEKRAAFLESIANNILELGDDLIERAHQETGLPHVRLQGERGRTIGQLRMFAQVVRDGHFLSTTIDPSQPERTPLPRADLRLMKIPLGPVAVFGASNFPLAFSVAGGDTASALAAGAPVIVKAHSAHLGTSELVGRAIQKAVIENNLPEGVFSLLFGAGRTVGEALVSHPAIKAVGFTGSRQGGLALVNIANARPEPIPVYAEMSSTNPVFLFPHALNQNAEKIARGFIDSLTMGAGQFCTNPGLVVVGESSDCEIFINAASQALTEKSAQTMLTAGIYEAYQSGIEQVGDTDKVENISSGQESGNMCNAAQAQLFVTTVDEFISNKTLHNEMFGPASIIVKAKNSEEFIKVAKHIEGQLTATLHIDELDYQQVSQILPILERKVGRILVNGYPTGVEVCHAMVHGGPFPSTSNSMFTSVGASAIDRFLRPVCYQDVPENLLPEPLKASNPLKLIRLVDGNLSV